MSRLADHAAGFGFEVAWSGVKNLPEPAAARAFRAAADAAFRRRGPAVVQLARNLRRVLGDAATPAALAAVTQAGVRSYARYWLETFRLPAMDHDAVVARAVSGTMGLEHLAAGRESGRGVVAVLPHSGNWDVAGLMVTHRFGSLTTVVERLRPERLFDRFVAYRQSLGMEILPLTGRGAADTSKLLKRRLREGAILCLVGDRDLTANGLPVDFYGAPARMPAGPAMLAAVTGADLCPAHVAYTETGWKTVIHPPMMLPGTRLAEQVRGATQQIADRFAVDIATAPADWHMMQPLWLADLRRRVRSGG